MSRFRSAIDGPGIRASARTLALTLCIAGWHAAGEVHAQTPSFDSELDRLDSLRNKAVNDGSLREAAQYSEQIGDHYVSHDKDTVTAADNFEKAGEYFADAARDSRLDSTRASHFNAALRAYAKARDNYRRAWERSNNSLRKRQAEAAEAAIAALKEEMRKGRVPIDKPVDPPPPDPVAPPEPADPTTIVPYTGPKTEVIFDLAKHHFAVDVPTLIEINAALREQQTKLRKFPASNELNKARGFMATNYLISAAMNQLDQDPRVTCDSSPGARSKHEKILLNGRIPACFITRLEVGHSHMTRSNAVVGAFHIYFELDKTFYRLWVSATLETSDPATPRLLGATELVARSLRLVSTVAAEPERCEADSERPVTSETRTFELVDDTSKVFFKVAKDNDDGVEAAKGMAAFWKAGTTVMELITHFLPPAAGKSGIGVGFVIDYLKKGGEILERLATSPLTRRALNVKAELYVVTSKVEVACETYETCREGKWVKAKRSKPAATLEGGYRASKRAGKGDNEWGRIEVKATPDLVDLDRLETWSSAFLEAELAKLKARSASHDAWLQACR